MSKDDSYHKDLIGKAESCYRIARELDLEAERLHSIAEFLSRRGDAISESAMQYANTGKPA